MNNFDFITLSQTAQISSALFILAAVAVLIYFRYDSNKKPRHKSSK
jgi:prolipoprotein diacylglyceryltransferase